MIKAAVLTISDKCSKKETKDKSGKIIIEALKNINAETLMYDIIADEPHLIEERLLFYSDELKLDIVFTTGGTGIGPRDVTPEATQRISDKIIPGLSELIRSEGLKKTKNSALSRGISAIRKNTIIINLPGSPKAVRESLETVLDIIPHALDMLKGMRHD